MFWPILEFVLLAAVIIAAGTVLARCADALAEITGLGKLVIGSVLLAGATSLPELSVDLTAVRIGVPDIAVGDLLGSCLMNLLILAVLDLTHHSRGKMLSRAAAAHALSGMLAIALIAVAGLGLLTADRSLRWAGLGCHVSVWIIAVGYLFGVRMVFLDQRVAARQAREQGSVAEAPHPQRKARLYVGGFIAAAAVVLLTGPRMAHVADAIADRSGLGGSFVGTTFVALSTSLPELVASFAAVRMGAFDLAIGNVFGSNAFNILLFVPLDAAYPDVLFAAASPAHLVSVLGVIVATAIVVMGQLYQPETRVRILEPDAWLVIAVIAAALGVVYAMS
jgi:cation:H+ antiporter